MKFTPNENILRVALIVFSILFGILSISLIALGVVYVDELWWPKRYVGLDFIELPTLLIVLGSVSLAMAIAGCVCAKTYNRVLLLIFAGILFTILCLELSIAIVAFINYEEHEGSETKTHRDMINQYNSVDEETRLFFRELEDHFLQGIVYNCCGVSGTEITCFDNSTGSNGMKSNLDADSTITDDPSSNLYPLIGCARAVNEQIQVVAAEIGYFTSILAVLQVIEIGYVYLIQQSIKDYHAP